MEKKRRHDITELNEYDRKILDKYSNYYTNFIESNTASSEIHDDKRYKGKET